jgi:glycosyltransferase involved in cell wall biosynthesis
MKILVVSHSSVVQVYRGKLRELSGFAGCEVFLIIPQAWPEGGGVVVAHEESTAYRVRVVRAFRLGRIASYLYSPIVFHRTVRYIRPDIVFAEEEPWSVVALQSLLAAKSVGARFVFFTWENVWKRYKWISERILRFVLNGSDAAVVGNAEGEGLLRKRGFRNPVLQLPQYGVDEVTGGELREDLSGLPNPRIGFVGRLDKEKGIHVLFQAVAGFGGEWSVVILGNGPEKGPLENLADTLGIRDRIRFIPAVPHEDVAGFMREFDILVLPSLTTPTWKEQFGRVLVEAMAAGVPVIGSDSGAIPEVIGDAGVVVKEGDVVALRRALVDMTSSKTIRSRCVNKGWERVKSIFRNDVVAARYFEFFRRLQRTS